MANITLRLKVKDKHDNFLNNVEVTCNGVDYYTDDNGVVEFSVPRDEDCTVNLKKDGFKELTKTISKRDLGHTVEIQLEDYVATTIKVITKDELGRLPYCQFRYNGENVYNTDENGVFVITEGITIGRGTFSVHENGYDVARAEIDVKAETQNHVTLNLHIQDNSYGYYIPTVYDACDNNKPLANANLIFFSNETSQIIARGTTDENGTHEGFKIYNKTTDFLVEKDGYVSYKKNYMLIRPHRSGISDATRQNIFLKQNAFVDIHVENSEDEAIQFARINYNSKEYKADNLGNFVLEVESDVDAVFTVYKDEYEAREMTIPASRLKCGEHTSENIRLTHDRHMLVYCRIMHRTFDPQRPDGTTVPLPYAEIEYKGSIFETDNMGITAVNVSYEENCVLTISHGGYESQTITIPRSEFIPLYPSEYYNLDVVLEKRDTTLIKAFVHNTDKTAIPNALIHYINIPEHPEYTTDETGHANFNVDNTETCTLQIKADGYEDKNIIIYDADLVEVDSYDLDVELTVKELPDKILLKNNVVDEDNNSLSMVGVEKDDVKYYTDENGVCSIVVSRDSDVTLSVSKIGYVSRSVTVDKAEFEGKTVYEHTIVLNRKTTTDIEATVKNEDGTVIPRS